MTKILFVSTSVFQPTGYAKISAKLLNFLAQNENNDIYHFSFSNYENKRISREINPRIKIIDVLEEEKKIGSSELYGIDIIEKFMEEIKPDILFIYNDLVVIARMCNVLINYKMKNPYFKTVMYLDLVYSFERYDLISHMDKLADLIFVFTDYWKNNLERLGIKSDKIRVLGHGIDEKIAKMDKNLCRELLHLNKEDFIFLNTNRNSYRKGWDITISAFIILLKHHNFNPKIKLFINCVTNMIDSYNILDLIKICCLKYEVDFNVVANNHFIIPASSGGLLQDHVVNAIYNATDVGLNTCVGEGFGLCNLEHASLGKPQVVSNVGGLKEIFKNGSSKLINPVCGYYVANNIDSHGGFIEICNPLDFANAMNFYLLNSEQRNIDGENIEKDVRKRFDWNKILEDFDRDFYEFIYKKNIIKIEEENILTVYKNKLE